MSPAAHRERIDVLLVQNGLVESREKAQAMIMAGVVFVGGRRADKPGERYDPDADIVVKAPALPFVSRGGLKMERALTVFGLDPTGLVALDVGASTGGFTDCLLQHGAAEVWAVDVGYGQLHDKIRRDPRVHVLERTNARNLSSTDVPVLVDLVVMDVSFISITKIVPAVRRLMKDSAQLVVLVKPQFEAGRDKVGRGVVRDAATHVAVLSHICQWLSDEDFVVHDITYSPVTGPEGNIEFLVYASPTEAGSGTIRPAISVSSVVSAAHQCFQSGKSQA